MSVNDLRINDRNKGWANLYMNNLDVYNGLTVGGKLKVEGGIQATGEIAFGDITVNTINGSPFSSSTVVSNTDSVINSSQVPGLTLTDVLNDHNTILNTLNTTASTTVTSINDINTELLNLESEILVNTNAVNNHVLEYQNHGVRIQIVEDTLNAISIDTDNVLNTSSVAGGNLTNVLELHELGYQSLDGRVGAIDTRLTTAEGLLTNISDNLNNIEANDLNDVVVSNPNPGEVLNYDGTQFVNSILDVANINDGRITPIPQTLDVTLDYLEQLPSEVVKGYVLGIEQSILAGSGQIGKSILAVGNTTSGKVQGVSLGDGNVIEVYASGSDFNLKQVLYREFMSLGEPICFQGLANGAIITSTDCHFLSSTDKVLAATLTIREERDCTKPLSSSLIP